MTEAKVDTDRHAGGRQAPDEHPLDERARRERGELGVKGDHHELLDAKGLDQLRLASEAGEELRGRGAPHHGRGMRLERQHGAVVGDHLTVPEVHAVKLTHGHAAGSWAHFA